jgi:hypothetical protein
MLKRMLGSKRGESNRRLGKPIMSFTGEISGSHGDECEGDCFLGFCTAWSGRIIPTS